MGFKKKALIAFVVAGIVLSGFLPLSATISNQGAMVEPLVARAADSLDTYFTLSLDTAIQDNGSVKVTWTIKVKDAYTSHLTATDPENPYLNLLDFIPGQDGTLHVLKLFIFTKADVDNMTALELKLVANPEKALNNFLLSLDITQPTNTGNVNWGGAPGQYVAVLHGNAGQNYVTSALGSLDMYVKKDFTLTKDSSAVTATDQNGTQLQDVKDSTDIKSNLPECGVIIDGTLEGCLIKIVYYVFYAFPGFLLSVAASFFNAMAAITLSSKLYTATTFITSGWSIVRDLANMLFIFILLFIAISLILDLEIGHASPKKMFASVILMAILLNFSMFFTEVIIDTSNIVARLFYNQIVVKTTGTAKYVGLTNESAIGVTEHDLSGGLAQAFHPQIFTSKEFWDKVPSVDGGGSTALAATAGGAAMGSVLPGVGTLVGAGVGLGVDTVYHLFAGGGGYSGIEPSFLLAILIISGLVFFFAAYAFFVAALSFLGRLIQLWVSIIFAPLAFVSYIVPSMHHIEDIGWSTWWKTLLEAAFSAPIFFFYLYIIVSMIQSKFLDDLGRGGDKTWFEMILLVLIPELIILFLLMKASKFAKTAAGERGGLVLKSAAVVGGAALGVGLGAAAFGGRRLAGAFAKSRDTEENRDLAAGRVTSASTLALQKKYGSGIIAGKTPEQIAQMAEFQNMKRGAEKKLKTSQYLASSSFDLRQSGVGNVISKATGMNMESLGFLSTKAAAGGYEGAVARDAEKKRKFAEKLGSNHEDQQKIEDTIAQRKKDISDQEEKVRKEEAKLTDLVTPLNELKNALEEARRKDIKDGTGAITTEGTAMVGGVAMSTTAIEAKVRDAQKDVEDKKKDIKTEEAKAVDLKKGEGFTAGTPQKIKAGDTKADGTIATTADELSGALSAKGMSLEKLEKALETSKKARQRAFFHQEMVNSGYKVHGEQYDDLGQMKRQGHFETSGGKFVKNSEAAREWGNSMKWTINDSFKKANIGGTVAKGIAGGIIGAMTVGPVVGAVAGLFGGGVLEGLKGAFKKADINLGKFSNARLGTRGTGLASDLDHQIHTFNSKYKAPASKFFDFLGDLTKGGGDHGGGGATHAGDHH